MVIIIFIFVVINSCFYTDSVIIIVHFFNVFVVPIFMFFFINDGHSARLWPSNLCVLCQFMCCLWLTWLIVAVVTFDKARNIMIPNKIARLLRACTTILFSCVHAVMLPDLRVDCLVHNWVWCWSRLCVGITLVCHEHGLAVGQNCWLRRKWQVEYHLARDELAEDKIPSVGWAINNRSSRTGSCSSQKICLSWLPHSLSNSRHSWYYTS